MDELETDYLVVGAGAMGMAFTDALVDHADVHVTLVDRRDAPGGHWRDAYPFVQLHQASVFYGVASTVLGDGAIQATGPEAGLHERAGLAEILAYYDDVLERLVGSGRVTVLAGTEYRRDGDDHHVASLSTGGTRRVRVRRRVVDAAYLEPTVPATTPPPFVVDDDACVVPVGAMPGAAGDDEVVVVGSGKTAMDAVVHLLDDGRDPDRLLWVRPRDPWMLDRARVQPDPVVITELGADTLAAAAGAASLEDLFLRLESAAVLLRIDPSTSPTMARTPTLARWELDRLRSVERVVRRGHLRRVTGRALVMDDGEVPLRPGAVVVHCAASGLAARPLVPIWQDDAVRLQTVRLGFPCFCAALAGYVEATREDDRERNRLCPPNLYGNSMAQWAEMQVRGARGAAAYGSEPDVAAWANDTVLNPSRVPADRADDPAVRAAAARLADHADAGLARMAELAGMAPTS